MLVKQTYLGLFLIFVLLAPVYVFESGLPQPADFLMAFLILVLCSGFIIRPPIHKDLILFGALFLGHVTLVNLSWWAQYEVRSFWMTPLYYAYDIGVLMVIVSLIREFRGRFVAACQVALALAIILEAVAVVVLPTSGIRPVGTFNNPNQLGYWGLLAATCLLTLKQDRRLSMADVGLLTVSGFVIAQSLSKAAIIAFGLLLAIALVSQRVTRSVKFALLALVFVSTAIGVADSSVMERFLSSGVVGKVTDRLENIGEQADDSLAGRGYDRIWRYPEYLVFGAGEGAAWRFSRSRINPYLDQREMHSTLGTVLFSYGIIGLLLFFGFLVVVFRRAPLVHILYSLPIWAYGLTHQGLRETMLWMFFGLVFGLAHYVRSPAPAAAGQVSPRASLTTRELSASTARSAGQ